MRAQGRAKDAVRGDGERNKEEERERQSWESGKGGWGGAEERSSDVGIRQEERKLPLNSWI